MSSCWFVKQLFNCFIHYILEFSYESHSVSPSVGIWWTFFVFSFFLITCVILRWLFCCLCLTCVRYWSPMDLWQVHSTLPSSAIPFPSSSPSYFCHISNTPPFVPVPLVSSFIPAFPVSSLSVPMSPWSSHLSHMLGCTEVSLMLYWSIPYGMLSFPFLVWVRMTFACIIPAMFLSEFELAPKIVITSLFYLTKYTPED